MEEYLADIRLFAGNFPPTGWSFCDGKTLAISENDALYTLIGTTYGGDGVTSFNLPDLRGRVPVGVGQGPGLPAVVLGQIGGTETATMTVNQMPAHIHVATGGTLSIPVDSADGDLAAPTGNILAGLAGAYSTLTSDTNLKPESATVTLSVTGSTVPFSIIQPYLTTHYIICIQGIYPSRN